MRTMHVACLAGAGLGAVAVGAAADEIQVLGALNVTGRYDTETGVKGPPVYITGLQVGEDVVAIDSGADGLYGLARQHLYRIDGSTGVATPVGPRFEDAQLGFRLYGGEFGFDFAPSSQTVRMLFGTRPPGAGPYTGARSLLLDAQTLEFDEFDPQTGAYHPLVYAPGDPGAPSEPLVLMLTQFSDPAAGGATRAIGIDTARNALVQIGAVGSDASTAEGNVVTTIAPLSGLSDGQRIVTFDMSRNEPGATPILLTQGGQDAPSAYSPRIYSVDLATGALTKLADFDPNSSGGVPLLPIDIAPVSTAEVPALPQLDVRGFDGTIRFAPDPRGTATFVGRIDLPASALAGRTATVELGGSTQRFTFNRRGRGVAGRDSFRVGRKLKDGGYKFTLRLRDVSGNWAWLPMAPSGTVPFFLDVFVSATEGSSDAVRYRTPVQADFSTRVDRVVLIRHEP